MTLLKQEPLTKEKFLDIVKKHEKIFLIFDYDGTIAPLNYQSTHSPLPEDKKTFFNELVKKHPVAIVTGRELKNLKRQIQGGLSREIMLFGTHGAEINEEAREGLHREEIDIIKNKFASEEHLEIEEKMLSITFHYRGHPDREAVRKRLLAKAEKFSHIFRIQEGHDVFEFLPKDINKGMAIDHIAAENPEHFLIYFGDDLTDNFAFERVNILGGLSVQVGDKLKERKAKYLTENVNGLYELVGLLL